MSFFGSNIVNCSVIRRKWNHCIKRKCAKEEKNTNSKSSLKLKDVVFYIVFIYVKNILKNKKMKFNEDANKEYYMVKQSNHNISNF